jgi:threonine/homoserine/homoserine lactone efflux protein
MTTYGVMANRLARYLIQPKTYKYTNRFVGLSFLGFGGSLLKYKPT